MSQPWVLGVGASHNGGACLMHGDEIVVAIQEERLAREKRVYLHAGRPSLAIEYCLTAAGIRAEDLNSRLKRREDFRPFAPAVLAEHASDWFEIENDPGSPFMLRVVPARPQSVELAPAIVHTDGTSRVQSVFADSNPRLYRLIEEFYALTGVPMLLNTSMNGRGEPIVERPQEAMMLALTAPLDAVYFGDLVATPRATTLRTLVPFALGEVVADDLPGTPLDAPDAGTNVAIRTPWGRVNHQVDDRALDLLRELDGRTVAALISEGVCSESDLVALQRRGLVGLSPR